MKRTVNGETESFVYDNNVISMSKKGDNYYYLQDELGSPMYMTGTDGMAVSSYAFDDFGRNIDPLTGKVRDERTKHAYTTNGNIIQPFVFTGYQEDEVSGLKFAQARYYRAETGRFQSEDKVRGFIDCPFTLNHYGYCWENPIGLIDNDGNWPKWVTKAADAVGSVAKKVGEFYEDHKEIINATLITTAAVAFTVVTAGTGAGIAVAALSVAGGTAFGVSAAVNGENVEKAFARGMADISVTAASVVANPTGAVLGFGGQVFTDVVTGHVSPPEAYVASTVGGSVSNSLKAFGNTVGGVSASVTNDILTNAVGGGNVSGSEMARNAAIAGTVGLVFDGGKSILGKIIPGYVKAGAKSIFKPFSEITVDGRTVLDIIDDFGRAAFGLNGGSSIVENYLDVFTTDWATHGGLGRLIENIRNSINGTVNCGD